MAQIILRSITPKNKILDLDKFERESKNALNKTIDSIEKDFKATYPKPKYTKQKASNGKASFYSDDEILNYNVLGTRPHVIRPRTAPILSFQSGYRRKTRNRTIGRKSGGPFGPTVAAKVVMHPGFEGTHVDKTIADKHQLILVREVKGAIRKATS